MPAAMTTAVIAAFMITGCGYSFVRIDAPYGANRIAVAPFTEETPLGIADTLTRALRGQLADGGVAVTHDAQSAQAVLSGSIVNVSTRRSPTTAGGGSRVASYRITLGLAARLVDHSGVELWSSSLRVYEDFLPPDSLLLQDRNLALATESNRRRALHRLAQRAAKKLHAELVRSSHLRGQS